MNKEINNLLSFINKSPTPFHAVSNAKIILDENGFTSLNRQDKWELELSKKYYFTVEDSTLIAFTTPNNTTDSAFNLIGAHTDSPNIRIKQGSEKIQYGYQQVSIEVYGGALLNSWIDRDLGIAGRVFIKENKKVEKRFIMINKPLARISQLAIHLNRDINEKGFKLNPETEIIPIFGNSNDNEDKLFLKELISAELNCSPEDIITYEISFFLTQSGETGGINNEFIYAPRIDNLAMCHAALSSIATSKINNNFNVIALFDHEEIGSKSSTGADSRILVDFINRISDNLNINQEDMLRSLANSFMISADMAHAIHSAFPSKHSDQKPQINKGPVIKLNSNIRYATSGLSMSRIIEICEKSNIPFQTFYSRADMSCGSTIGPTSAAILNIPVIDIGNALLSMHSSREVSGTEDHPLIIKLFKEFFN
ncbi:MAG: M18 family aminopeptidase [Planctomycetota bacterium]|nr:MAG: M18 family aminopeptidase [Planctomycetota bacterium]